MYVVLLDEFTTMLHMRFMVAVHARLAGNADVEVPDLNTERQGWEGWLMSDPPKSALRTNDQDIVYAALFPENAKGLTTEQVERLSQIDRLRELGHVTEVSESV